MASYTDRFQCSGDYPPGCSQADHDRAFNELGPEPDENEDCPSCGSGNCRGSECEDELEQARRAPKAPHDALAKLRESLDRSRKQVG